MLEETEKDSSLKIKTDFVAQSSSVTESLNMLKSDESFASVLGKTAMFFDFGAEKLGYLKFKITASEGTLLDLMGIVGIKPEAPGFKEFSFKPNLSGLKHVNAKIPTPHGFISFEIDSEKGIYKLDYPENCKLLNC